MQDGEGTAEQSADVRGDGHVGLHGKYIVRKADTGEPVFDCFVLRPDRDPHARKALTAYMTSVAGENPALANDLAVWLMEFGTRTMWSEIEAPLDWHGKGKVE